MKEQTVEDKVRIWRKIFCDEDMLDFSDDILGANILIIDEVSSTFHLKQESDIESLLDKDLTATSSSVSNSTRCPCCNCVSRNIKTLI